MNCPIDNETLLISNRNSIEIDYCPKCRGVWLDRGELDKIIDHESSSASNPPRQQYDEPKRSYVERNREHPDSYRKKPKRHESFLGDLFDF